jgi:pimeloyl-ACP methyl ester carboxylesterase
VIEARLNALLAYDAGDRLRRIVCPTLILAAHDDLLIPPRMSQAMADAITGARTVLLPSGGHVFPRTRADEYTRIVFEFIKSVGRRSGAEPRRKGA